MTGSTDVAGIAGMRPLDLLSEAADRLGAVSVMFRFGEAPSLSRRDTAGVHQLLTDVRHMVLAAESLVNDMVSAERATAERVRLEFERGFKEGREHLFGCLKKMAEAWPGTAEEKAFHIGALAELAARADSQPRPEATRGAGS